MARTSVESDTFMGDGQRSFEDAGHADDLRPGGELVGLSVDP
jgi:hypothetical protein